MDGGGKKEELQHWSNWFQAAIARDLWMPKKEELESKEKLGQMFAANRAVYNNLVSMSKVDRVTRVATKGKGKMAQAQLAAKYFGFEETEGIERLREGEYYLIVPQKKKFPRFKTEHVCAIDPGVRNFVTVYDPDGRTLSVNGARSVLKKKFEDEVQTHKRLPSGCPLFG
eukprot:jgi/Phyca11/19852/fgenesh1_pg.PHYCAscaffold_53_\